MKDVISYNDFFGSVHFDSEDQVFHGKIDGIEDLVTFEGTSVSELVEAFEEAVEDYLDICSQTGKRPEKSYRGSFNVRITPELHRQITREALLNGLSLNQFIQQALEAKLAYKESDRG